MKVDVHRPQQKESAMKTEKSVMGSSTGCGGPNWGKIVSTLCLPARSMFLRASPFGQTSPSWPELLSWHRTSPHSVEANS